MDSLRVLIVDDEEELVRALVERLNLRGFSAVGVGTGTEALERVRSEAFDVLLVDVKMPKMDGLEVIRTVKAELPSLQVVLLTGHGSVDNANEGKRLGAFDYLLKPIDIDELIPILVRAATPRR